MNIKQMLVCALCVFGPGLFAEEEPLALDESVIQNLVREALQNHPRVETERFRVKAAEASLHALRLWEDPGLTLGVLNAEEEMRRDNGDLLLGIEQALPRQNLYRAEKSRREAEVKVQDSARRVSENEIGLEVAKSALELALADEVLRLQGQEIQWVETLVKAARERSKNPDASAVETLRLESELALRLQNLEAARRGRVQLALTLNLLLGRDAEVSWPLLALVFPENSVSALSREGLLGRLEEGSPALQALRHQIESAQAETDASKAMRRPMFMLGLESRAYSGGDFREAMLMLKMSLPWGNGNIYNAEIEKAGEAQHAAQSELSAETREQVTELSSLWIEAENQRLLEEAYSSEVLPKAERTAEAVQNAWVSSKASLLEVLEARNALLQVRREQKRAVAARQVALHSLSALLGGFTPSEGN